MDNQLKLTEQFSNSYLLATCAHATFQAITDLYTRAEYIDLFLASALMGGEL